MLMALPPQIAVHLGFKMSTPRLIGPAEFANPTAMQFGQLLTIFPPRFLGLG